MTTERILYTDGHDVTVTESTFRVRKSFYRLDGITRHSFAIIRPNRLPGIFLIGLGLLAVAIGMSNVSLKAEFSINLFSLVLGAKTLFLIGGFIVILAGALLMGFMREKYGVHIVTAEGERDVLVSDRREYVSMVVEALNKAFLNMLRKTGRDEKRVEPPLGMQVSHR
jgi:hypothetical protein